MSTQNKIIVLGASGYIGGALYLNVKNNCLKFGTNTHGSEGMIPFRLDEPEAFNYSLIDSNSVVLLTAAISAPDICAREHERAWAVNVTGTSTFINKVLDLGAKLIFFSSDTTYGERTVAFDESVECNPAGEYAEMKREVEQRFLSNPLFKTIRLSYVFSRDDKFTKYLINCAKSGEVAEIFHPFYRAVVHREDVVEGALALAERWDEFPQNIINFGGPEVLARTDYAEILTEEVLPSLRYRVIEPDADFFKNRPKTINMVSPILPELLGRPTHTLREAAKIEL